MPPRSVPAELRQMVNSLQGAYDTGPTIVTGDVVKDIGLSSGMQPYDLAPYVTFLFPTFSPLRNKLPRWVRQGKNFQNKAVTNPDTNNVSGIATEGTLAAAIATQFADVTAYYKSYGVSSDPVTYEQIYAGEGKRGDFSVDSRSLAIAQLLKAMFIKEERLLWFAQGSTTQVILVNNAPVNGLTYTIGGGVGTAPAPTLTQSATGGTVAANTYYFSLVAIGSMAVPLGMPTNAGKLPFTAAMTGTSLPTLLANVPSVTTAGATSTITVTIPVYQGQCPIIGWLIFGGLAADPTTHHYQGSTNGASFTLTATPSTAAAAPPVADTTSNNGAFNSVASYIWAINSGSTIKNINGALTSADQVNGMFIDLWENAQADPDTLYTSGSDMPAFTKVSIGSGSPYFVTYKGGAEMGDAIGNYRVSRWINPVTSKILPINVHAYMPQGSAYALTEQLPAWYVGNDVPSVFAWVGAMDYLQVDYAPTPATTKFLSEIRCFGAPFCFLPSQHGVLAGMTKPVS